MEKSVNVIGFVAKSPWYGKTGEHFDAGWYNGYLLVRGNLVEGLCDDWHIPEDDFISSLSVHGGFTLCEQYDGGWKVVEVIGADDMPSKDEDWKLFGWDYGHLDDTHEKWTLEAVRDEVRRVVEQCQEHFDHKAAQGASYRDASSPLDVCKAGFKIESMADLQRAFDAGNAKIDRLIVKFKGEECYGMDALQFRMLQCLIVCGAVDPKDVTVEDPNGFNEETKEQESCIIEFDERGMPSDKVFPTTNTLSAESQLHLFLMKLWRKQK